MSRNSAVILAVATFFMLIISIITLCRAVSLANHPGMDNGSMTYFNTPQGISNHTLLETLRKSDRPEDKQLANYLDYQEKKKEFAKIKNIVFLVNYILAIFYVVVIAQNDELPGVRKAFWIVAVLIGNLFIMSLYAVIFLGPVILGKTQDKDGQLSQETPA